MTPLKETLEATSSAAESASVQAADRSKSESGHLRSDAVSLDVPVKVHGSRVTEVVRGITPHTEPFEEQTSTMIVFPQGGVLRMTTAVSAGQMLVLTNLKSGHDAICRVVKVRACAPTQSYVELEFTNRQPGYWGVRFPADEIEPAMTYIPPPVSMASEAESAGIEERPPSDVSWAPAAALQAPPAKRPEPGVFPTQAKAPGQPAARPPQQNKKESTFVGIGSQEDVQPAASATVAKSRAPQRPVASSTPLSMNELRGEVHAAPPPVSSLGAGVPGEMTDLSEALAESSEQNSPAAFGRFAASASLTGAHPAPQKAFGARFDSSASGVSEQPSELVKESGHNWFLLVAGIAALLVAAAGGAMYFHVLPGGRAESKPLVVAAPAPAPAIENSSLTSPAMTNASQIPVPNPVAQISQPTPAPAPAVSSPVVTVRTEDATPQKVSAAPAPARVQPSAPVTQKPASRVPDISASLSSHPVSARRSASGDAEPAPSVDGGASSGGELQQGLAATSVAPPPPAAEPTPIRIGGDVQPPKLVNSVAPVYPTIARTSGIYGNVVIVASIDKSGKVTATKVVSGPVMLRQAAVDALRRWIYSPATLNGDPVAVDVTVTVQFHR